MERLSQGELQSDTKERSNDFLSREQVDLEKALELAQRATACFSALQIDFH